MLTNHIQRHFSLAESVISRMFQRCVFFCPSTHVCCGSCLISSSLRLPSVGLSPSPSLISLGVIHFPSVGGAREAMTEYICVSKCHPMSSKKTDCSFARISVQRSTYTYSSLPSRTWFPSVPRESYSGTAGAAVVSACLPACSPLPWLRPSFSASGVEGRRGLSHLPGDGDGTLGLRGRGGLLSGCGGAVVPD